MVASCLLAGAAWRLAQGPIELGWLADRARAALADETSPVRISFGSLALAWEGFHKGVDYPLDLRVSGIELSDPAGHGLATAPDAHLTLSLAGLILGRIVPRTIEVDQAQVALTRENDGAIDVGPEPNGSDAPSTGGDSFEVRQIWEQLRHPATTDHGQSRRLMDQIQRAHFHDTRVTLRDRVSGLVVQTPGLDVDLGRAENTWIHGAVRAPLSLGNEQATLIAAMDLSPNLQSRVDVRLSPFRPSAIGALPAALAFLGQVDVPVSLSAAGTFDASFHVQRMQVATSLGSGRIMIEHGAVPLRSGTVELSGTPGRFALTKGRFDLAQSPDSAPELVEITGTGTHVSDRLSASLSVVVDQINVADLPRLWPRGIGAGARPWITEHITGGMATHGTASFVIESDEALHDVVVTKATAELDGSNAVFTWLDNIPPIEQAAVHLHLVDADTLDIQLSSGRQRIRSRAPDLLIKDGRMRITGLSLKDQAAAIHAHVDGQIASALALLSEPRLHLLSAHPIALKTAGGDASATLDVQFPLENKLQVDDIQIHAAAELSHVRVLDVAAGHQLDDGAFDVDVDKDGLTFKGRGSLAAVSITLNGSLDFTPGSPDQIIQKINVAGQADAAQLDAAGLPVKDVLSGPIPMTAVMLQRRNGEGSVSVGGDLTQATMVVSPLAWTKPAGIAASATALLLMSHDRLTKIDRIMLQGDAVLVTGSAGFVDGHLRSVILDKISLGRTQAHGVVHVGARDVLDVVLQGSQLDLLPKLMEKTPDVDPALSKAATAPAWTLNARFDRALLANGEYATNLLSTATGGGDTVQGLNAVATTQGGGVLSIKIEPKAGRRHLAIDAQDAGRVLLGADVISSFQSGHLTIDADFGSPTRFVPLAGVMTVSDVVAKNSPALGKLLQAITLYGLVDALHGPGMTFTTIIVPFRYDGRSLNVNEAHASNSSLGLTANGRIGLSAGQLAIKGTIVPVYFFNAMLGQLPVVGKLFSPEKGGGVFAIRFGIDGSIEDPVITINPISALTPGFLRDFFNVFDHLGTGGGVAANPR